MKSNESAWNYLRGLWNKYKAQNVSTNDGEEEEMILFNAVVEKR